MQAFVDYRLRMGKFSENLRDIMLKKGMNQKELAEKAGIKRPLISYYLNESKFAKYPSLKTLIALALPPLRPPRRPNSTAAGFLVGSMVLGSSGGSGVVASLTTILASSFKSGLFFLRDRFCIPYNKASYIFCQVPLFSN